jgi:hypothetical protein
MYLRWRVVLGSILMLGAASIILVGPRGGGVEAQLATPVAGPAPRVQAFHDLSASDKAQRADVPLDAVARWAQLHIPKIVGIASGTPQVILTRRVLASELPGLGIPFGGRNDGDPPLALVILRGEFDFNQGFFGYRGKAPAAEARGSYVALVYDLWAQLPTAGYFSVRGGMFRKALNDPSLPAEDPFVSWPTVEPGSGSLTAVKPPVPPNATPVAGTVPAPPTPTTPLNQPGAR